MITDAIKSAQTEHTVYFLLTAYVETLGYAGNYGIPETVKRLPIRGRSDVCHRLRLMRETLYTRGRRDKPVIEEVADVLNAAAEQLETL